MHKTSYYHWTVSRPVICECVRTENETIITEYHINECRVEHHTFDKDAVPALTDYKTIDLCINAYIQQCGSWEYSVSDIKDKIALMKLGE